MDSVDELRQVKAKMKEIHSVWKVVKAGPGFSHFFDLQSLEDMYENLNSYLRDKKAKQTHQTLDELKDEMWQKYNYEWP